MRVDREHARRDLVVRASSAGSELVERADRRGDRVVVDVLVRDEADRARDRSCPRARRASPSRSTKSLGQRAQRRRTRCSCARAAGSTLPGQRLAERVGEPARPGVVVGEPLDHRLERDDPGRGDHAGLAHAAAQPRPLRARLGDHVGAARTAASRPARSSPFDRQNITVSAGATSSRGATPSATAAFQMRAPSTCTAQPAVVRDLARASPSRRRRSARPTAPCTCSRSRAATAAGRWCATPSIAVRTPSGRSHSGCICTPLLHRRGRGLVAVHVRAVGAQHLGARRARARGSRAGSPSSPTARRARPPCRAAPPRATAAG